MARQNRVTPLGELIADPARGLVYGNRGCLHDEHGRIRRRYNGKLWIACRLRFKDWHRHPLMQPGKFTELFFLDEATAFAAGHRPCALCRREDYNAFRARWREIHAGEERAVAIDARLHAERLDGRARRLHDVALDDLPDGTFVLHNEGVPWLVLGDELRRWTPGGYAEAIPRPRGERTRAITPPSLVEVLRAGWDGAVPFVSPSRSTASRTSRS
jgi:hypothetical protein